MGDEPPDPGDTVPQVSHYITVDNNQLHCESSMDTDVSSVNNVSTVNNTKPLRKRTNALIRICKHCNKKRRRQGKTNKDTDCSCINDDNNCDVSVPITMTTNGQDDIPASKVPIITTRLYQASDIGPYVVHVQKQQLSPDENVTLHPVSFGRFLKNNEFKNILNGSLKRIGRNRLSLTFTNFSDANNFTNDTKLSSNRFKAFIPSFNISRMGIVRGIPKEWSAEEVIQNVSVPPGCGSVLKARRLKKKIFIDNKASFIDTETVVLTFDGQILPKRIFICFNSFPVDLYIYPTIQCFKCCRYGHVKDMCRSNPRCFKCGKDGHSGSSCTSEDEAFCCICHGSHYATNKICKEFLRQKNIKEHMAKNSISYVEASKTFPTITKSYSDVVATSLNTPSTSVINKTHINNNKDSQNVSYKKTVFLKPRQHLTSNKGYDIKAHNAIINEFDLPSPKNGCALNNKTNDSSKQSIVELIITLLNILNQNQPSNVAQPIMEIINNYISQNGQLLQGNSVELS